MRAVDELNIEGIFLADINSKDKKKWKKNLDEK
jgi:hypothetical protein